MKRTLSAIVAGIIALVAMSCETANLDDRLATPNFNVTVDGNTLIVAWEKVTGAAYYEVSLNPGSVEKTDKTIHRFDELQYNTTYVVSVRAIATDVEKSSEVVEKSVKTEERIVPAYREWVPTYGAAAQAISNNGRWVVGGNDRNGFLIDLSTDKMTEFTAAEFYDVADDGTAVGSDHSENPEGDAAILIGDNIVQIKGIKELASAYGMSCATGITPDGEYVVGWFHDYDETSYYGQMYGYVIPFCYDVIKERISIPAVGNRIYNEAAATAIKSVTPERELLGYEQSEGIHNIVWKDEYTPFEYAHFQYNEQYEPVFSIGDTQNFFTQKGSYIYGKAVDYSAGQVPYAAAFDRKNNQLITLVGGSVTAMSEDGIAYLNDVPYYIGTTSYVIDTKTGVYDEWTPLEEWLFDEHDIDIAAFEPIIDENKDDGLLLEGVIVVAVSEDNRKIVGITNSKSGWVTFVVDFDGEGRPGLN
ncbi:MAG: hypothetical protein J6U95_03010 [Alistipes sp.]|nr:hypothetical protein [Alistipes sp.]